MAGKKRDQYCPTPRTLSIFFLACTSIFLLVREITLPPNPNLQASYSNLNSTQTNNVAASSNLKAEVTNRVSGEETEPPSRRDSRPRGGFQIRLRDPIRCDRTHDLYDICSINGPTVLDPTNSTFYVMGPTSSPSPFSIEKVKPYPRKFSGHAMSKVEEVTIISGPRGPECQVQHAGPALVFSAGGYTGNFFHEFNEGFVPLFVTVSTIFPHQEYSIVVPEAPDWWLVRYQDLLRVFTKNPIISLQNDTATHCFASATIGLITHGSMTIDQKMLPNPRTFLHFRGLLDQAFRQNFTFHFNRRRARRPRLVLVGRTGDIGRVMSNQDQVVEMLEDVGFQVIVFEPTDSDWMCESYALVNSSHAMVGVHGAALTHALFLRPGSVFVQVVPLGIDWAADEYFGRVGRGLNLEYLEYKIGVRESSLLETYGKDNVLLRHARTLGKGWPEDVMDFYLRKQNVKIDLLRFRAYMKKAYVRARKFMRKNRRRRIQFPQF